MLGVIFFALFLCRFCHLFYRSNFIQIFLHNTDNNIKIHTRLVQKREQHIIDRRGQEFYDKYRPHFAEILTSPDYIFPDKKPDTALVSKTFSEDNKTVNVVLRLVVEGDDPSYKNSIISAIGEGNDRFEQRLNNNTPIYKRLDNKE